MKRISIDLDTTLKTTNSMYACCACPWICGPVESYPEATY